MISLRCRPRKRYHQQSLVSHPHILRFQPVPRQLCQGGRRRGADRQELATSHLPAYWTHLGKRVFRAASCFAASRCRTLSNNSARLPAAGGREHTLTCSGCQLPSIFPRPALFTDTGLLSVPAALLSMIQGGLPSRILLRLISPPF